jgi:Ribonucleotide reductase, barrel domain
MKPIDFISSSQAQDRQLPFQVSSRIRALESGSSKSIGASCNYYRVEDNLNSIAYGQAWGTSVLGYQGAPSWDLSLLRPSGAPVSSKGTASGAVSFAKVYDVIVGEMRREEKKNGAGLLGIDYRHPELPQFLEYPFKHAYRAVYLPMHDTPEAQEFLQDTKKLEYLAKAYNDFKCYLVKRPLPLADGTPLGINLCTEVEIPHKGFCILGAFNLSYFTPDNIHHMPSFFAMAMRRMVAYEKQAREAANSSIFLPCASEANRQVGLGIYGLSSVLGAWGITYEEFNSALQGNGVYNSRETIEKLNETATDSVVEESPADVFVCHLIRAYYQATLLAKEAGLRAAFCIQPTVSTSQRSLDHYGYNVSPEVQPVDGIKHSEGVSYLRKSAIKGDSIQVCHPGTWTLDEVPYETYAETSALLQQLMDATGLAHRHSHCFYGERFTAQDLRNFYTGNTRYRKSLYYRLPYTNNTSSLRKDELWQDVSEGELFDGDLSAILQKPGSIICDCEN